MNKLCGLALMASQIEIGVLIGTQAGLFTLI